VLTAWADCSRCLILRGSRRPEPAGNRSGVPGRGAPDSSLLSIPVVVLTTSQAQEDIVRSYSLHANAYISKPVDFDRFAGVVGQIEDFFLTLVKLPTALS